jgi:hypothetical protein
MHRNAPRARQPSTSLACPSHKRERPLVVTPELKALVDDPTGLLLVAKDVPEAGLRAAQDQAVRRCIRPTSGSGSLPFRVAGA